MRLQLAQTRHKNLCWAARARYIVAEPSKKGEKKTRTESVCECRRIHHNEFDIINTFFVRLRTH